MVNSLFTWVLKPSGMATVPPPVHLPETVPKCEKSAKEASYICNSAADFNRCISKLQDEIQSNVRVRHELSKGKSMDKACQVLTEEMFYMGSKISRKQLFPCFPINIFGNQVSPAQSVNNLGVVFDSNFTLSDHVSQVIKSARVHARDLYKIHPLLDLKT